MNQNNNDEMIKICNVIRLIAAITCIIGVFLPYISLVGIEVSLKETYVNNKDYGYLIGILAAAGFAFILSLNKTPDWGILGAAVLIIERISTKELWDGYADAEKAMSAIEKVLYKAMVSKEAGYYCIIIGSIALFLSGLACSVLAAKRNN